MLHRDTNFVPRKAIGGKGSYIFLEDGTRIFDSTGGPAVSCLGHGDDEINETIKKQMSQISYCHSGFFGTQVTEDLAQFLTDSTGGKLSKLFIISSGMFPNLLTRFPASSIAEFEIQGLRLWKQL